MNSDPLIGLIVGCAFTWAYCCLLVWRVKLLRGRLGRRERGLFHKGAIRLGLDGRNQRRKLCRSGRRASKQRLEVNSNRRFLLDG